MRRPLVSIDILTHSQAVCPPAYRVTSNSPRQHPHRALPYRARGCELRERGGCSSFPGPHDGRLGLLCQQQPDAIGAARADAELSILGRHLVPCAVVGPQRSRVEPELESGLAVPRQDRE